MSSRCRDSAPRRASFSLSHSGLAPTAADRSRPRTSGPEAGSARTAPPSTTAVSGSGVAPTPTSALLQGPHEPGRSNKGRLLSSSPVSSSASAGPGTWEEPEAACGVCGPSVKSKNCSRALITYKAGHCFPGKNSLYLHLPPEGSGLAGSPIL